MYATVLGEQRIGPPTLDDEQRAHIAGMLRGQVRFLVHDVQRGVAGLHGETRRTADYVMARAGEMLALPYTQAREPDQLFDLAVLARSLLTLHELATLSRQLRAAQENAV
ncbi:hypothetical protein ACFVY4_26790 [Streptomyces sp. NPDC058299]|uniref:hypothetical protein n=1 Tax=Streptomyces sp. NPDC058299 TaxID=3346435 RepID=UPI0036E27964